MKNTDKKKKYTWDDVKPSGEYKQTATGKKEYTSAHITNTRPDETEWFRIFGKDISEIKPGMLVKLKIEHEKLDHLVLGDEDFTTRVELDFKKFRKVHLAYYVTKAGRMGIWPISIQKTSKKKVGASGKLIIKRNAWIDSAIQIIEKGQKKFVRVTANMEEQCYDGWEVDKNNEAQWGEPNFKKDYLDVVVLAWGDRILDKDNYDDHPYVKDQIQNPINLKLVEDDEEN